MINVWNEGIYVQGSDVIFRVDHCTFDNVGFGAAEIIRPRFVLNATIKNSIFSNVPQPRARALLIYGASEIDHCAFYKVGAIKIQDSKAATLGEHVLLDVAPQYSDLLRNDFSLSDSSPLLKYTEDGGPLGDPNWSKKRTYMPAARSGTARSGTARGGDSPEIAKGTVVLDDPRKAVKSSPLDGAVIQVGLAKNALVDALKIAKGGDILELTEVGEYLLDDVLRIGKSITIRAAEGLAAKPVIKNVNPLTDSSLIFEVVNGGNLTLSGLDLDGIRFEHTGKISIENGQ